MEHLPLASSSVDAVLCHQAIYHAKSEQRACAEIWRVLKKGGVLWLRTDSIGRLSRDRYPLWKRPILAWTPLLAYAIGAKVLPTPFAMIRLLRRTLTHCGFRDLRVKMSGRAVYDSSVSSVEARQVSRPLRRPLPFHETGLFGIRSLNPDRDRRHPHPRRCTDNKDPHLAVDSDRPDFWDHVRGWAARGWTVGMHGYQHHYVTSDPGIVRLNPFSEFAGLPLDRQRAKLQAAKGIFDREGVTPRVWIAPAHSFDAVTVSLLREAGIGIISDGFGLYPSVDRRGILWIPQQIWRFRRFLSESSPCASTTMAGPGRTWLPSGCNWPSTAAK